MGESREFARLVMEVADRAYLTAVGADGYPVTRAMLNLRNSSLYPGLLDVFARHRDDFLVHFSTNTSSAKVREIPLNSRGCAYYCHPKRYRGVALVGDLEISRDATLRRALWQNEWIVYYPGGVDDPDYTVVTLRPRSVRGWSGAERFEFAPGCG
jgi:general stress protein 26